MDARDLARTLGLAWLLGGCADEPGSPSTAGECTDRCVADPLAHYVCLDSCRTDAECPGGFVCSGQEEEGGLGQCAPPQGVSTPSALLIDGFGVAEMPGAIELVDLPADPGSGTEGVRGAELSWRAPAGARVVHCALFVCAPRIVDRRIVDYERCVIADKTVERGEGTERMEGAFSLYDEENQRGTELRAGICGEGTAPESVVRRYAVTELLAGCWAYDDVALVATTSLVRPSPTEVFDFHETFAQGKLGACLDEGEDLGRSCALADGTFGVCAEDGQCARRCLGQDDCEVLVDEGETDGGDEPMWQCESLDGELVGPDPRVIGGLCRPVLLEGGETGTSSGGGG